MLRLADLIDANLDKLAIAESRDTGKPISLTRAVDIPRSAANVRFFATAILHSASESHFTEAGATPGSRDAINYTLRRPRGVAGLISPWNLPLYLLTWKIAPAIATGNTCVAKPSEVTPVTAHLFAELVKDAGFPAGVVNIIHGTGAGAGAPLVTHPDVPTISFTGSTGVGKWIAAHAGEQLKRVSLELGGKNPFVIFEDANVDEAISTAARAAFTNQGQICLCGSRLIVHRSIKDRVLDGVVRAAKALRIGDPLDAATQFGSLVSTAHLAKVAAAVEAARAAGGTIHCGGSAGRDAAGGNLPPALGKGCYYPPTVISGLNAACAVEREEIFGPVVTVQTFDTEAEALTLANGTDFGLAATIFTRDVGRAHRFAANVNAGIVWVNCWMIRDLRTPFGGMKQSGVGREGGVEAIKFFTEPRNVCVAGG